MKRIWFLLSILLLLLSGCNFNNQAENANHHNEKNQVKQVKNSTIDKVDRKQSEAISKHLANLAAKVPNVKGATAIAIGNYAIVGIDVDKDLDRSKVGTIKYSVAEALKHDKYGANAIVIADPDITARLEEIGEDIRNGHPIQGILNELSDIVGRIMPEIPGDLQEPTPKNEMEESKKEQGNRDSNQLEKNQDKQSNNQKDKK